MQADIRAGTLKPVDYTNQNSSYATAAGGAISTADDMATWIKALVSGKVFNADYHQQWLTSLQAEDPDSPDGQKYGYGISYQHFSPTAPCTTTAASCRGSTPLSVMTRITM